MSINRGSFQSGAYFRETKVLSVRKKGKAANGAQIWELTLADGTSLRTSSTSTHPFTTSQTFRNGTTMRLGICRSRGTVLSADFRGRQR